MEIKSSANNNFIKTFILRAKFKLILLFLILCYVIYSNGFVRSLFINRDLKGKYHNQALGQTIVINGDEITFTTFKKNDSNKNVIYSFDRDGNKLQYFQSSFDVSGFKSKRYDLGRLTIENQCLLQDTVKFCKE